MANRKKRINYSQIIGLSCFTLLLILITCVTYTVHSTLITNKELQQRVLDYENQKELLITANKSLQGELDIALKLYDEDERLTTAIEQVGDLTSKNDELHSQLSEIQDEVLKLEGEITQLNTLNDTYQNERKMSVQELEKKYTELIAEAKNEKEKYEKMNEYFHIDNDLKVKITQKQTDTQRYFVTEVITSESNPIQGAFANNELNNKRQSVSKIASQNDAILAINASGFYTDTDKQMGTIVRDSALLHYDERYSTVLGVDTLGNLEIHTITDPIDVIQNSITDTFTFGPVLINNYEPQKLPQTSRQPRTAIGQLNPYHYVILVVDGRQDDAQGMTLNEIQDIFIDFGCSVAYNLDGGGSSTLYFKGNIINTPSEGRERYVPDILFF